MARWAFFQPPSDEEVEYSHDEEDGEVEEEPQHKLRRRRLEQEKQEEEENDDSSGSADEKDEDDELQEEEEEEEDEGEDGDDKPSIKGTQSPWDFATFSESVAEEHARRRTTSIDEKISKARQQLSVPLTYSSDEEDAGGSDAESDKQVLKPSIFFMS